MHITFCVVTCLTNEVKYFIQEGVPQGKIAAVLFGHVFSIDKAKIKLKTLFMTLPISNVS